MTEENTEEKKEEQAEAVEEKEEGEAGSEEGQETEAKAEESPGEEEAQEGESEEEAPAEGGEAESSEPEAQEGEEAPKEGEAEEGESEEEAPKPEKEEGGRKRMTDLPKPVKAGDELEVTIESVGAKGDGIAKKDGFVIFVPGVQKGDTVKVRIVELKTSFAIGEKV